MKKKQQLLSLEYGEAEHVLSLLWSHATANAREELTGLIERLAEEPRAILCQNPMCAAEAAHARDVNSIFQVFEKPWMNEAKNSPSRPHFNELEHASGALLLELYALLELDEGTLAATWWERQPHLEAALYAWLHHHDSPEAERTRRAPARRGKTGGQKLARRPAGAAKDNCGIARKYSEGS